MGGTFDPIHIGHLILGESAYEQFALDRVLFMPSGNPPHKTHRSGAGNDDRVEMVRRAIAGNDHFELSLTEMHDSGYTYTRQTLEKLTAEHPDTDYYFIMGADSLFSFDSWKDPEKITQMCVIVAAVRDRIDSSDLDREILRLREKYSADIRKLESPNLDIASSTIRAWAGEGKSIRYYVTDPVYSYIREHQIYRAGKHE